MANILETEIVAKGVEEAYVSVEEFGRRMIQAEETLNSFGEGDQFAEGLLRKLSDVENKANSITKTLDKSIRFNVETSSLDSMSKRALELKSTLRGIDVDLKGIGVDAARAGKELQESVKRLETANANSDILGIRNELKLIKTLRGELDRLEVDGKEILAQQQKIEARVESLAKKREQLNKSSAAGSSTGRRAGGLTDTQANVLEFADNFAPVGTNRAFNSIGRGLFQIESLSAKTLIAFGGIAAAGALIVGVTDKIRTQAESRLKNEELISAAINKQVLGLQKGLAEYEKFKRSLADTENFAKGLETAVNLFDTKAVNQMREKVDKDNKAKVDEVNRLQADVEARERALEFAKTRATRQNVVTELGLGKEYTESQKRQDIATAERSLEQTRKAQAEAESGLEKGKANLQQIEKSLDDITKKQNQAFSERGDAQLRSQEQLVESEKRQLEFLKERSKKIIELRDDAKGFLTDTLGKGNPLVKLMTDFESATDRAEKRFGLFGKNFAAQIAEIERKSISEQLNKTRFESDFKALRFEQQANALDKVPEQQRKAVEARSLSLIERKLDTLIVNTKIEKEVFELNQFASNREGGLADKVNLERLFNLRNSTNEKDQKLYQEFETQRGYQDALKQIRKLESVSLDGTGLKGQNLIAGKIIEILSPIKEGTDRNFNEFRRDYLNSAFNVQKKSNDKELSEFIEAQKINEQSKKDAYQQIDLLNKGQLSKSDYYAQLLAITSEIPTDELDPNLLKARKEALKGSAAETRKEKDKANEVFKEVSDFIKNFNKQITEKGLKVDLQEQAVTQIEFDNKTTSVEAQKKKEQERRPNQQDVATTYREYQEAL